MSIPLLVLSLTTVAEGWYIVRLRKRLTQERQLAQRELEATMRAMGGHF